MLREQHVCECGNEYFMMVGKCSSKKMFLDGMKLKCAECGAIYDAKTGEKVVKCKQQSQQD